MSTRLEALAAVHSMAAFIGPNQMKAIASAMRGEEKQYFFDKVVALDSLIFAMPITYAQNGLGDQAIVTIHYFTASADFYITEKDSDPDGDGQIQAFGLADLFHDGGELGYISIPELLAAGAELDLYFTPKTLGEIRKARQS